MVEAREGFEVDLRGCCRFRGTKSVVPGQQGFEARNHSLFGTLRPRVSLAAMAFCDRDAVTFILLFGTSSKRCLCLLV